MFGVQTMQLSQIFPVIDWNTFVPIFAAVVMGAVIGLEREIHRKAAGLRTNIMICMGAALFTVVGGELIDENAMSRVIQGVITGVGFIGAGTIIRDRASVHGITTAATIWLMTGIGIACGHRMYEVAIGVTVLALVILGGLNPLDKKIHHGGKITAISEE